MNNGPSTVSVGDTVAYVDERGRVVPALLTALWHTHPGTPSGSRARDVPVDTPGLSANLVVVDLDEAKEDNYGRQVRRETSQPHRANQAAPGRYWMVLPGAARVEA